MTEELLQRNLINNPDRIGKYIFYNIGATTIKQLRDSKLIKDKDYSQITRNSSDSAINVLKQLTK